MRHPRCEGSLMVQEQYFYDPAQFHQPPAPVLVAIVCDGPVTGLKAKGSTVPELTAVYAELHAILAPYAAELDVKRDDGEELYVDTRHIQKNRKPLFFGAVQKKKSYVAFHLMPVYTKPELLESISTELRSRMQGKSCFNFKSSEPALFKELAGLTRTAFASYEAQGFTSPP